MNHRSLTNTPITCELTTPVRPAPVLVSGSLGHLGVEGPAPVSWCFHLQPYRTPIHYTFTLSYGAVTGSHTLICLTFAEHLRYKIAQFFQLTCFFFILCHVYTLPYPRILDSFYRFDVNVIYYLRYMQIMGIIMQY